MKALREAITDFATPADTVQAVSNDPFAHLPEALTGSGTHGNGNRSFASALNMSIFEEILTTILFIDVSLLIYKDCRSGFSLVVRDIISLSLIHWKILIEFFRIVFAL